MSIDRKSELQAGLASARSRIESAAQGRHVDLLVVTKTYPASDIDLLHSLGVRVIGENRDQEAKVKAPLCPGDMQWHMIGQVQRNKANSIARWASVVQTLDRTELLGPLSRGASLAVKTLGVLIQVNLDPEPAGNRGGALPHEALGLAHEAAQTANLELMGVMGVAPHPSTGRDPHQAFLELTKVSQSIALHYPNAQMISAGMSGDLEAAVSAGATQVRLGSAILGQRTLVQ